MKEQVIYGAGCSWFGSFGENKTLSVGGGLPCCPFCRGVLMQIDKDKWDDGAKQYAQNPGEEDYLEFLEWAKKQHRCYPNFTAAKAAFREEKARG